MEAEENLKKSVDLGRGLSFISFENNSDNAYAAFLTNAPKLKKLCISREHPDHIRELHGKDFEIVWMQQKMLKDKTDMIDQLQKKIHQFLNENNDGVVLLERIDYLINLFGFDTFLQFMYRINEDILGSKSLLLVHGNPGVLSEQQKNLLTLELKELPKPAFVENIKLAKDIFDILSFIKEQDTKVSFKTICKKFFITKATARKRVYELHAKNLVVIKKDGRSKIVELARDAYSLF